MFESGFEKERYKNINEFHGTRDFYHLIKITSKLFIKRNFPKESYEIENILNESIERNFGGLDNSIKIFKKNFKKYVPNINEINEYDVMNCIKNNILDSKSRYLLIETKSSISHFLITLILDNLNKNHVFYYGSNFEEDTLQGYYSAKVLSKVQITMSMDNVMILKNLTSMYPSLYDLFNQNFRKVGKSNYARIALGDSNTQNYFVNDNFRCVILLDKNEIDKQDPPFINRFEKHIITFEYLLNKNQVKISNQINQLFNGLIGNEEQKLKINLKFQLLNCDLEEIQGIVYQLSENIKKEGSHNNSKDEINLEEIEIEDEINTSVKKNKSYKKDELIVHSNDITYQDKIFEKIIPTFSQDIIFYGKNSNFFQKYKEEFQKISDIYLEEEKQHNNLKLYLENIKTKKHIIYTFSNILDSIFGLKNEIKKIENNIYGNFTKENTRNIFVDQYNSERGIDEIIYEFYTNESYNLCVFHFDVYDCVHLNHINYLIENNENSLKNIDTKSKVIIFIIHLKRIIINNESNNNIKIHNEYLISHLTEWKQFFIDNLNGIDVNLKKIFESSNFELFYNKDLIDINEEFTKDLYHAFTLISYNFKINFSDIKNEEYIDKICEFINNNEKLKLDIQNLIKNKINTIKDNILMKIFTDYNFEDNDLDLVSVIIKYLKSIYNRELINTLIQLEKYNILSTKLLNQNEMNNEFFEKIYQEYINKFDSSYENYSTLSQIVKINLILGISYPCIIIVFNEINQYTYTLIESYLENEDQYRNEEFEDTNDYFNEKNILEKNLEKEFEKKYFIDLFKNDENNLNKNKLKELLFKDYMIYYCSKSNKNFSNKKILNVLKCIFELFISRKENENNNDDDIGNEEENQIYSLKNISKFVLFIESYKDFIYPICDFISIIDIYINDFIKKIISIISSKSFKIGNRKISYVNDIFFNIFESIVYSILTIKQRFEEISDENFEKFLDEIKIFSHVLMKANVELCLTLKQILYLFDFIQVKEIFGQNGIPLKENLQIYYNILKIENEKYLLSEYNINKENKEIEKEPINEGFKFLKKKLCHLKGYQDLIVKLINNKMKISKKEEYRVKLLKILCSNNLLIIKSKIIFQTILKKFKFCPINKDKIKKEENEVEEENEEKEEFEEEENEFDDGSGVTFLTQFEQEKNNLMIKFLNKTNNICLDEILLSLFDVNFSNYFKHKGGKENLILNQSLNILKKCVNYIEGQKCIISENNRLGILYCISYIKYYCYNFAKIIYDEEYEELPKNEIYEFLNGNSKFRKIIKIYILKILNLIMIGNYKAFLELIEEKNLFTKDFDFSEKVPCYLDYLFIQNDTYDYYKQLKKTYGLSKMENYISTKDIVELIDENRILIFYDLLINEEISNLQKNVNNNGFYNKLSSFVSDILNKKDIPPLSKNIISIYTDYNSLIKQLPSIQNLSPKNYEILLYAHKLSLICSFSKANSFYAKILNPEILNNILNIYIPGGEPNDSLLIKSGDEIKQIFQNGKEAVYMCSCYFWYNVSNCGRPTQTFVCSNCGQTLGGNNHILFDRPGHVRICQDNQIPNDGTRYKTINQLMDEVENEKKIQIKGFKKVKYSFFKSTNKIVRNMTNITYRVLSFIFYSCIYYNEKLGYLQKKDLDNFNFSDTSEENNSEQNKNPIEYILIETWKILKEELLKREIQNIQCFLNMIIPKISEIIFDNDKGMINENERFEFENKFNEVIENSILNYKEYYDYYKKKNNEILGIEDDTFKSILQETSDINNLHNFPLINYFYAANYPNYDKFWKQFTSIQKADIEYPVVSKYLLTSQHIEDIKFLENFHLINPFVTFMLDKYSNKISREEAKKKTIKGELKNNDDMQKLFDKFKKGWKNIYKDLSNYDCNGQLPPKNITEDDCLAYCLNDNLENDYGKYIATAYKDFITYQNEFLKPLIENNSNNEYLYPYSNKIKKKIIVQNASKKEIVSLNIKNDIFQSFDDLINTFSFRNCFKENGDIHYLNYREYKFDFYSIEVELSKILLPEKRLFCDEQNQNFISYTFEGFNQNECIILDFKEKIKECKLLSNEEKVNLSNLIERIDYNLILFNLQSLFLYFVNKKNISGEEILIDEINQLPKKIIKLDEQFIQIFENPQLKIQLNQLIDCYDYIEFLNYDKILTNVSKNVNTNLENEQIEKLNQHFDTEKKLLIKKGDLGIAVRKFISRFLIGERFKNFDWNIFVLLKYKNELWNDKIIAEENEKQFNEEIEQLENINIKFKQAIDFYEKLGGERAENKQNNKNNDKENKKRKKKNRGNVDY